MKEERYNVEIYEYSIWKTIKIIWENMSERSAEKREETWLSRCNKDYWCRMVKININ